MEGLRLRWMCVGGSAEVINLRIKGNHNQCPPFSNSTAYRIMWEIAYRMRLLRERNIPHRNLKASNALVRPYDEELYDNVQCPLHSDNFNCVVADFECSGGVVGTGFWRAAEILRALKDKGIQGKPGTSSGKTGVYSYAVACFEVLTGKYPFADVSRNEYEAVVTSEVQHERPQYDDTEVFAFLERRSHMQLSLVPTFRKNPTTVVE